VEVAYGTAGTEERRDEIEQGQKVQEETGRRCGGIKNPGAADRKPLRTGRRDTKGRPPRACAATAASMGPEESFPTEERWKVGKVQEPARSEDRGKQTQHQDQQCTSGSAEVSMNVFEGRGKKNRKPKKEREGDHRGHEEDGGQSRDRFREVG